MISAVFIVREASANVNDGDGDFAAGVITRDDLVADYYDEARFQRETVEEITLFKNGGGAHLDLMTSRYILDAWRAA